MKIKNADKFFALQELEEIQDRQKYEKMNKDELLESYLKAMDHIRKMYMLLHGG